MDLSGSWVPPSRSSGDTMRLEIGGVGACEVVFTWAPRAPPEAFRGLTLAAAHRLL